MSWDYTRRKAICKACGHTGVCIQGSDDRMGSSTTWGGFRFQGPERI